MMTHQITERYLKKETQEFDLETIFILNLKSKSINDLGCIGSCVNLIHLNLSNNNLRSVMSLRTLLLLERLDISLNKLSALSGLENLESLKWLNVSGNLLTNIDCLLPLTKNMNLKTLILKDKLLSNPLLDINTTPRADVISMLSQLEILDGESLIGYGKDFNNTCSDMEGISKEYSNLMNVDFSKWKSYYPEPCYLRIGIEKNKVYEAAHSIAMECEALSKKINEKLSLQN